MGAWLRRPIRDCNYLLVAALQLNQALVELLIQASVTASLVHLCKSRSGYQEK